MKPFENKCLIIIIVISIIYLFINFSKKETFENLDTFITNTNNGNWNFASYNPYSKLNNFTDTFYIINNDIQSDKTYNERLKYNKNRLINMESDSNIKTLIKNILNTYNNNSNTVSIKNVQFTKFGIQYTYSVMLINAYDKLNYVKNKAKVKNLINTSLINDMKKYFINKYIENVSQSNEFDEDENIIVEFKYIFTNSTIIANGDYNESYILYILNKIKKYLKMDIINNGTKPPTSTNISIKFKVLTYNLDDNDKQIVNDKITTLYKILFLEILNNNEIDSSAKKYNILDRISLSSNEQYIRDICVWKSGLCKKETQVVIKPNCSVPNGDKTILNKYTISYNNVALGSRNNNSWKNHIIDGIMANTNSQTYNCNIYDIDYNINGNQEFTLNLYDSYDHSSSNSGIGTNIFGYPGRWFNLKTNVRPDGTPRTRALLEVDGAGVGIGTSTFNTLFNVNAPTQETSCKPTTDLNINNYVKELDSIKGLNKEAKDNVQAILLADLSIEDFDKYKVGKNKKELDKVKHLRLKGKVFKLLEEYSKLEKIDISIKTKIDNMEETKNDIIKNKLYGALHNIVDKHLREKNEEFKLTEILLTNDNKGTKKRYELIYEFIPETTESKLIKLIFMTTPDKINYFDKKEANIDKLELELKMMEKMSNEELAKYFEEINEYYTNKNVNYRLKKIIKNNKNNILRIHKKLNSLSGGVKKFTGGSIINEGNIGIGSKSLILNSYLDLSFKNVTSNINDIAFYKNKIYIIGNSGYFAIYDLNSHNYSTPLIRSPRKYDNLNNISINTSGKCVIVGDNGTIMYCDLDNSKEFQYNTNTLDNKLLEVLIQNNSDDVVYIVGEGIKINTTYLKIFGSTIDSDIEKHYPCKYFNIFNNINSVDYYCLNLNKQNNVCIIQNLNRTGVIYPNLSDSIKDLHVTDSLFITNNNSHNLLIYKNTTSTENNKIKISQLEIDKSMGTKIYEGTQGFITKSQLAIRNNISYSLKSAEKIESCFTNNINTGMITDKLNYYQFNGNTTTNINLKQDNTKNISNSKLVCYPNQTIDHSNVYHIGSHGKIYNYNINHRHNLDLTIKPITFAEDSGNFIKPNLSGIDRDNNNVYIINNRNISYELKSTYYDISNRTIQMKGNENIHRISKPSGMRHNEPNIKLIRYDYKKIMSEITLDLYSIISNNKKIKMEGGNLLSNKFSVEIPKNEKNNKNEFVSLALIINDRFKIWLKPEKTKNMFEYIYEIKNRNINDNYKLARYINGNHIETVSLNFAEKDNTKIGAILYDNIKQEYNRETKTLNIDSIIKTDNYKLLIVPESGNATIIYDKKEINKNESIDVKNNTEKINIIIKNGEKFSSYNIKINYGIIKKIGELKDYESQYLINLPIEDAYNYLNSVNKNERTLKFLLKKYRLEKKEDVQTFLGLMTDKTKRDLLENEIINILNPVERTDYIKRYLQKKPKKKIIETEKPVVTVDREKEKMVSSLKTKLEKMKIEKDILSNQYKIEQRNKLFDKGANIVEKKDIKKIDTKIESLSSVLQESETNKSKSFFDKLADLFSSDDEDKKLQEKIKLIESNKMANIDKEHEEKMKKIREENELKIKKMTEENKKKMEEIEKNNKIALEKSNALREESQKLEEKEKAKLDFTENELELKEDMIKEKENKMEMENLFNIQSKLLKKQKTLLKIIKSNDKKIFEDIKSIQKKIEKQEKIEDTKIGQKKIENKKEKILTEKEKQIEKEMIKEIKQIEIKLGDKLKNNVNNMPKIHSQKTNYELLMDYPENDYKTIYDKIKNKTYWANEAYKLRGEKDDYDKIMNIKFEEREKKYFELEKMYNKKMDKKKNKPCVSFMDCYFKNLDDNFYSSYKNDYTFIKDAELPKEKNPVCKPKKDCDICYLNTNGVPNSINYNKDIENKEINIIEKMIVVNNNNVKPIIIDDEKYDNEYFKNNYENLPDCPFDPCMSCEDNNKYSQLNNVFKNDLIEKYRVKKK